ncbi:MAG: 2-hydroxyacid dehydrogenase, partial [Acidimicrobiia bacterium]
VPGESVAEYGARAVSLEELLERSDFVSIHCVLTPETRGLIGEAELRRLKDTAYLIDVSRGAIIRQPALLRALSEGWIAGAGLDVFPVEPLTADDPLLRMDNVLLTSHLAWYTVEADERLAKECMARVIEVLEGRRPRNIMNAEALGVA